MTRAEEDSAAYPRSINETKEKRHQTVLVPQKRLMTTTRPNPADIIFVRSVTYVT